jgi:hypothetical protein
MLNLLTKSVLDAIQLNEVEKVLDKLQHQSVMIEINMKGFVTAYGEDCFCGWIDENGIYIGSIGFSSLIPWDIIQSIKVNQVSNDLDVFVFLGTDCSIRIYN